MNALLSLLGLSAISAAEKPNFIMLLVDDMGWGDTGFNGHPVIKTPNLDQMAENGLKMNRFYSTNCTCSPSRAAILTGRHNLRLGLTGFMSTPSDENPGTWHLLESEITYAEALQDAGYATAHFGKWHVGYMCPEQSPEHYFTPGMAGFEEWFTSHNVLYTYDPYQALPPGKDEKHLYYDQGKLITLAEGQKRPELRRDDTTILMDRTLDYIERMHEQGRPFAVATWFHHMHGPLSQNPDLLSLYPAGLPADEVKYYSNASSIDIEVGRLRAKLRELGIADNTMILFTSDNGPVGGTQFRDRLNQGESHGGRFVYGFRGSAGPFRGGKYHLGEGGILVPGVIEWPAQLSQPAVTDVPLVQTDYFPTVLEAAGVAMPDDREYDGISWMPLFRGEKLARPRGIAFSSGRQRAYRNDTYKVVSEDKQPEFTRLYNLLDDPYEEKNLVKENPELFESMVKEYEQWEQKALADWQVMLVKDKEQKQ